MSRPAIPAEIKRAVLVEAGHRCAIPRCGNTELDIHHIIPWAECKKHEFANLIALCPVCHRRVHKGDIDRKSLLLYKQRLAAESLSVLPKFAEYKAIEVKRLIHGQSEEQPRFTFDFEFPDFTTRKESVVSKNLEAWGNELLLQYQEIPSESDGLPSWVAEATSWLKGSYRIIRRDSSVISVQYTLIQYPRGAAHRSQTTKVQNFFLSPFEPITLENVLVPGGLEKLSAAVRQRLLSKPYLDKDSVNFGTEPDEENFKLFTIGEYGINFLFQEYQVGCYAVGAQEAFLEYDSLSHIFESAALAKLQEFVL